MTPSGFRFASTAEIFYGAENEQDGVTLLGCWRHLQGVSSIPLLDRCQFGWRHRSAVSTLRFLPFLCTSERWRRFFWVGDA